MGKGSRWLKSCWGVALVMLWVSATVQAQNRPEDEYKDLIRISQNIQPLGQHPFGMDVGLYDGTLSFEQTDIRASGNGPVLEVTRRFSAQGRQAVLGRVFNDAFGDWELDLPRISTLTAQQGGIKGWEVGSVGNTRRCTHFGKPPSVPAPRGDAGRADWEPATWWHGYQMIVPGQGSQDLLSNGESNKSTYPAVTKTHWRIGCLASTANGQPGEGFLAEAPDGTRYWFNELVYRWAPSLTRPTFSGPITRQDAVPRRFPFVDRTLWANALGWLSGSTPAHALPANDFLNRREAWMLVTRVEDRFGNWLKYGYDGNGRLTTITASDGRKLTVQHDSGTGLIKQITLQPSDSKPKIWKYAYTGSQTYLQQLSSVTLPDGQQWKFKLEPLFTDANLETSIGSCYQVGKSLASDGSWTGTITHPSGLKGSFTVKVVKHGRSNVFRECLGVHSGSQKQVGSYAVIPNAWYNLSLVKKHFSGAGLDTETWTYDYSAANESWSDQCNGSCASTVWTKVRNPDGSSIKYTFSNRFDETESRLQSTKYYSGDGKGLLRTETNSYAKSDTGPWPERVGWNPQERINKKQTEQRMPLAKKTIKQDGDTYTWKAESFNKYAQVTRVRRSNSIAGQSAMEEQTSYRNDTDLWVLGLPEKTTNLSTGDVVAVNTYDPNTDLLTKRLRFGQLAMQYTWDGAGQLASFTDANGNTTALKSYKHGIPRSIQYADGTSQSLEVDDFGQITAVTDQAGNTTKYVHDAAGRVTKVTPPSDSVAWYPQTITYQYVTSAERGLGKGHWKRTASQGKARHETYYDALLRPVLTDSHVSGDTASHRSARTDYNWKGLATFASWAMAGSPSLSAMTDGTTTQYDALGRIKSVSTPSEQGTLTTTTSYPGSARKQIKDPAGHVSTMTYQVFDQPSYEAVIKVQAPESVVQTITRNLYGSPLKLTQSGPDGQGGSVTSKKFFYYDGQQRLCRTEEPETGSTVMAYDAAGNLAWSADGLDIGADGCGRDEVASSGRITHSYDALNRLVGVSHPDAHGDIQTTYDAMGRVTRAQAGGVEGIALWSYKYDSLGHVIRETLEVDGHSWPIAYRYDRYGHLDRLTYPDNKRIDYAPDALGQPTRAGIFANSVGYFPDGGLEYFVYGNGMEYLATRNERQLPSNLTVATGKTFVYSEDLAYDKNGNITGMTDLSDNGERTRALSYDALNRLTKAKATKLWGTETYAYDALNNLRGMNSDGVQRVYQYDGRHLLKAIVGGGSRLHDFSYDAAGNNVGKDGKTRVFSAGHRLLEVPGVASYLYDAAGRRVRTTAAGGQVTYYAYNQAGRLLYEEGGASGRMKDYVYLGNKLVGRIERAQGDPVLNRPGISIDTNPNDGSYDVSWAATKNTSYVVEEQHDGGSWTQVYSGTSTHHAVSGKGGGDYRYRVKTCDDDCSDWGLSAAVGVTPAKPKVTLPSGLQKARYTVKWNKPASTTAFGVQEQADGGSWTSITCKNACTSVSLPGDRNGDYKYRVRASNSHGNRGWVTSGVVTVLLPPGKAPSLKVPATNKTGSFTVSWGAVTGAASYALEEKKNSGKWGSAYVGKSRSRKLTGKTKANFSYRIKACNASGCSSWSTTKTVIEPPTTPKKMILTGGEGRPKTRKITVHWNGVSRTTGYEVEVTRPNQEPFVRTQGTSTGAVVKATADGTWKIRVRACNQAGCSGWTGYQSMNFAHSPGGPILNPRSTTPPPIVPAEESES